MNLFLVKLLLDLEAQLWHTFNISVKGDWMMLVVVGMMILNVVRYFSEKRTAMIMNIEQCCFWGRWWQQLPWHGMEWQQLPWQLLNCWIPVCNLLASSIWTRFALFLYSAVVATVPSPSKLSSSSTLYLAQRHFPPNHLKPLPLPLSFHCALQIKANHCPIPESTFFFFLFTDIDEDWRRQPGKMEITFQWDLHGPQSRQRRWYGRMSKE